MFSPATQKNFRHGIKQVGMSHSATPATQNDMRTCLETFEKERCCSFPHRHGDATGKPETRDETRGRRKTTISRETSPILTLSTWYKTGWNVTKCRACHKIDVSCEASVNFYHISQNATRATEFAPCRHLTQPCQCDL